MAIEFDNPVTAGTVLVRESIQSQNFLSGLLGWIIEANGNAEFNNLTIRGTFNGTNFVINSNGAFFYSGIPATGNLIVSIAATSGNDAFGNTYPAGLGIENSGQITVTNSIGNITTVIGGSAGQFIGLSTSGVTKDVIIRDGIIQLGNQSNSSEWAQIFAELGNNALQIASVVSAVNPFPAKFRMFPGQVGSVSGSSTAPLIKIGTAGSTTAVDMNISGNLYKADLSGVTITRASLIANTNWAQSNAGGTSPNLTYYLDNNNNLRMYGTLHATAAMAAGNHQVSLGANPLPTNYRPNTTAPSPAASHTNNGNVWLAQALLTVTTAGIVQLNSSVAPAINDIFYVDATIPLAP